LDECEACYRAREQEARTTHSYTALYVEEEVTLNLDRLFEPWTVGRPAGWSTDTRTKALVAAGYWLREELVKLGVPDEDRKTQEGYYYRRSRSEEDIYMIVTELLNEALAGTVEKNRKPHRRWG
jgi:hypothetical protein